MTQTSQNSPAPVQLWHIGPAAGDDAISAAVALLQPAELERMRRMRAGLAREEMVIGRASLRVLLGEALGCRPDEVRIESGPDGKPHCVGREAGDLHFNLAHSHGHILIAISDKARVGVDLERIDSNVEIFEVAHANFAAGEIRAIKAAPSFQLATQAFYRIWTGKEALLKAHGSGLLTPLNGFDLGSMDSAHERRYVVGPQEAKSAYYLRSLPVEDSFVAALALSEPDLRIETHRFEGHAILGLLEGALTTHF